MLRYAKEFWKLCPNMLINFMLIKKTTCILLSLSQKRLAPSGVISSFKFQNSNLNFELLHFEIWIYKKSVQKSTIETCVQIR